MTYVCIKCNRSWFAGGPSGTAPGAPTFEASHGLCHSCITEYIRERQRREGSHDCFKRAVVACSVRDCKYWRECNRRLL